jgi:murein L,D-transpeptidase YafK
MANHFRIGTLVSLCISSIVIGYSDFAGATGSPESLLEQAMSELRAQKNKQALQTLNQLIAQYPDFQLAQLMRADLLYAQGNLLSKMGQPVDGATNDNLQAEAKARIKAIKQPPEGTLPDYVMQVPSWLSHMITVDLGESRAYLFDIRQGQLVFITSYYLTQGKLGAGKEKEGDKRSPIGAYRLSAPIPPLKLTPFYGAGALPLDYPNTWDKRKERSGHGIWLHGTPIGQYSRPPKASDGCMVFSNEDLQQLMARIDWQRTLVITDSRIKWQQPDEVIAPRSHLMQTIENWRRSWEQQEISPYMRYYATDFIGSNNENKAAYETRKKQLFSYNRSHKIQISDLLLYKYPGEKSLAVSVFTQNYQRDGKSTIERKRLWWQWQNDQWKIISEEILPLI